MNHYPTPTRPPEQEILINISAGQVIAATYTVSGIPLDPDLYANLVTVEDMFAIAQGAINNADAVTITYNSTYGFPESIYIDWIVEYVHDETGYHMRDFVTANITPFPAWLDSLIATIQAAPVTNPPTSIYQYNYNGSFVYYVPPRCCDIYSDLYDANGNLICHPDGGITGSGDGLCRDFISSRTNEIQIWKDGR